MSILPQVKFITIPSYTESCRSTLMYKSLNKEGQSMQQTYRFEHAMRAVVKHRNNTSILNNIINLLITHQMSTYHV